MSVKVRIEGMLCMKYMAKGEMKRSAAAMAMLNYIHEGMVQGICEMV